ncbi:MAG: hypothetical protein ABIR17_08795 [Pseudolysinimonas sp.]|uniref:hypothetical protein n=1 Tax=Pseudolysinimonas sp. TaxID=2680009 RepID=UPI003264B971
MPLRPFTLVPVAAFALAVLAGCTFSIGQNQAPLTVPPEDIEKAAASALEHQTGVRPDIDCGQDPIPVEVDGVVTCLLVDPVAGLEFNTVITFDTVEGDKYSFDIKVADVPNNVTQPTAAPGASVPVTDIEGLAIRALTPTLDFVPEVTCDATEVEIVVGNTVNCSYDSPNGTVKVVVTITQFDGSNYSIRVD